MEQYDFEAFSQNNGKENGCHHHWIIETPAGPVSQGVCRLCEEVREFKNYIEGASWDRDVVASHSSPFFPVSSPSRDYEGSEES